MKIVILTSSKEQQGGVERFSFYLHTVLINAGHTVIVIGNEDITGFRKILLNASRYIGLYQPLLGLMLGTDASQEGFDVCVTNGLLGWNIRNKKVINVQHGTFARAALRIDRPKNYIKFIIKRYIWGWFEGVAARRATICVAVSNETKESVERFYGVSCVVVENAVDTDLFMPRNKEVARELLKIDYAQKVAVFVGRFEYAKGKAILEGIREYLAVTGGILVIAEQYAQESLALLYGAADVFLLPSLHEGCSYALLEAMSSGAPFLVSPVGLAADFKERNLFPLCIVDDQTIPAYSSAMDRLFSLSNEQSNILRGELRTYILEHHNLATFKNTYEQLISQL